VKAVAAPAGAVPQAEEAVLATQARRLGLAEASLIDERRENVDHPAQRQRQPAGEEIPRDRTAPAT
jgi:hypothetical protein